MDCKNLHWYVISVTSGKEIKTRDWLLENKERFCVDDTILDKIFLPVQKKIVVKDGKKTEIENSLIGPYIYVHCDITNENLLDFFRQAPNVYSFVGSKKGGFRSGAERVRDEDINRFLNVDNNKNTTENTNFYVGDNVELISAASTKDELVFVDRFKKEGISVHECTDDGSCGFCGFSTQLAEEMLAEGDYDIIVGCGPEIMSYKLLELSEKYDVDCQLALDRYMKCGLGICGQCCIDDTGYRVCVEGPVFDKEQLSQLSEFGMYRRDAAGSIVNY